MLTRGYPAVSSDTWTNWITDSPASGRPNCTVLEREKNDFGKTNSMSSEVGNDIGGEAISWGRGQEEEASSGRMVDGIDEDEVLSPTPLTAVPPRARSSPQAKMSRERVVEPGTIGQREAEVTSGLRTAPIWKCKFFPSEVNEGQLREWHQMYRILDDIEFIVSDPNDQADDPPLGCVALNQAVLAAGLRLPFPRIVRKFLREWRIAPIQLCTNGWRIMIGLLILWDQLGLPLKAKTGGSVVTQTLDSIKNWKKFWFFVRGPWQFTENDARSDVNIPVRYHELRYVSQEPTEESSERARRAQDISENLRSSSVLIIEENLISARLSPSHSDHRPRGDMKDISALLRKKTQTQAVKGKRKVPAGDQERSARLRMEPELPPWPDHSPARSVEEITTPIAVRAGPSSSQPVRPPPFGSQLQPTYLGSTPKKDEKFVRLPRTLPKPIRDFIRSNSPTREEIASLPMSTRRAIKSVAKCWTPAQQKYLEIMGMVDSIVAASVNVSRAAIQLTSASEKMDRLLSDVQVMRDEGRKVLEELKDEKRLRPASEDVLLRREEELRGKDAELRALAEELETANKSRTDLEHDLEVKRKSNAELKTALEKNADKE
ncbi:Plus3 domain-containing protein [Abeliophyllum distichum]|uniref:Plus3 domain-containing protein n=1 Tax=Abeliophyllum distichum TaxID=126358 RepID=A0ABD1TGN0_9LAMI